ncbi:hypothetical protein DPEC_G00108620 [Dallia pectoralis]|uniref:Uncharacterized protein n=1 Tax=Dallia pectoralis TaxID=75939 RepID=A0ACC2GS54_DALPE|nr:hypothetical protein DPEC_G00108620 [Dallia pectoralis]
MDPKKVQAVQEWPRPNSRKELQRPGSQNGKPDALSRVFSKEETRKTPETILPLRRVVGALQWGIEGKVRAALRGTRAQAMATAKEHFQAAALVHGRDSILGPPAQTQQPLGILSVPQLLQLWMDRARVHRKMFKGGGREGFSPSSQARPASAPIYVYTRPVFIDQNRHFLSQGDMCLSVNLHLGGLGKHHWRRLAETLTPIYKLKDGLTATTESKANATDSWRPLSSYLATTLNAYITNVTTAAPLCSAFLCQGNGRCIHKDYESDHHLHLSSGNFRIFRARGRYTALGLPSLSDLAAFARGFTCQCYAGQTCNPKLPIQLSKALMFRRKKHLAHSNKIKTLNKNTAVMEQSTVE